MIVVYGILATLALIGGLPSLYGLRPRLLPEARLWGAGFGIVAAASIYGCVAG